MLEGKCFAAHWPPLKDMTESSTSGARESRPDEIAEEKPRRSREEILRQFKLALAIGDGSLLEIDQDRARGVDPYDNSLGTRQAGLSGPGARPGRR